MTASVSKSTRTKRLRISHIPRDSVLFFTGIAGVIYETVFTDDDRVQLLLLFGAMMGLPAFLRADEARGSSDKTEDPDAPK